VTSPDKVFYPATGKNKLHVIRSYAEVSPSMFPPNVTAPAAHHHPEDKGCRIAACSPPPDRDRAVPSQPEPQPIIVDVELANRTYVDSMGAT
jgi:hypothetical protein